MLEMDKKWFLIVGGFMVDAGIPLRVFRVVLTYIALNHPFKQSLWMERTADCCCVGWRGNSIALAASFHAVLLCMCMKCLCVCLCVYCVYCVCVLCVCPSVWPADTFNQRRREMPQNDRSGHRLCAAGRGQRRGIRTFRNFFTKIRHVPTKTLQLFASSKTIRNIENYGTPSKNIFWRVGTGRT